MARLVVLVLCVGASLALGACGENDETGSPVVEETPTGTAQARTQEGCESAEAPEARGEGNLNKPKARLDPDTTYVATVSTNCGDFQITLDAENAPLTGASFKALADKGFYDGTTFHRIVPGFVIQGGDPKGDGTGGPGYSIVEAPPEDLVYEKGVVAMAKADIEAPGTSGSQFFVVTGEVLELPPDFALLGRVSGGQEVVDRIAVVQTDPADDKPVDPVVIRSVKVAGR